MELSLHEGSLLEIDPSVTAKSRETAQIAFQKLQNIMSGKSKLFFKTKESIILYKVEAAGGHLHIYSYRDHASLDLWENGNCNADNSSGGDVEEEMIMPLASGDVTEVISKIEKLTPDETGFF